MTIFALFYVIQRAIFNSLKIIIEKKNTVLHLFFPNFNPLDWRIQMRRQHDNLALTRLTDKNLLREKVNHFLQKIAS